MTLLSDYTWAWTAAECPSTKPYLTQYPHHPFLPKGGGKWAFHTTEMNIKSGNTVPVCILNRIDLSKENFVL